MSQLSDTQPPESPRLSLAYLTQPPRAPAGAASGDDKPPLVLLLHGVGSNEGDLFALSPLLPPRFRVLSLRAPLVRGPASFAWFDVEFLPDGFKINSEQLDASRRTVIALIAEAVAAFDADPAQVYLLGFSQGAILSLAVTLTQPELLAGVVALSGRIPPEVRPLLVAPERTAGLPVFLGHGRLDTVVPYVWAERAREVLERQRVALDFFPYEMDHRIAPDTLRDATAWLAARLDAPRWHTWAPPSA
jgi:phospholipase/carboxylesterase